MAETTSEVDGLQAAPVDVSDNSANQDITANATALSEHAVIAGYTNNLTPPVDTSFWRYQTFSVFDRQPLRAPPPADPLPAYLMDWLTWNIDAYVYTTNARPDGEFQKSGGAVYVVLVHRGRGKTDGFMFFDPLEYQYTVTLKSNGGSAELQLPSTDSGTSNNETWTYPIRFNQSMQMFKNGGMEPSTFQATYEHDLSVKKGEQKGLVESPTSVQWSIAWKTTDNTNTDFPITALSVFRINHLGTITFDCTASVRYTDSKSDRPLDSITKSITVNCHFST